MMVGIFLKKLTKEEEKRYLLRIKNGDFEAKLEFMAHYFWFVEWLSQKYCKEPAYSKEDLVQEGMVILLDTINKYDMSSRAMFLTYFSNRLRWRFIDLIDMRSELIKRPARYQLKIEGNEEKITSIISLDTTFVYDEPYNDFEYERIENKIDSHLFFAKLKEFLEPREYYIIYCIFFLDRPRKEVYETLKISESRLSQIIKEILEVIKNNLNELYSENKILSYKK